MSDRGKFLLRNPADAIAAAKCWLATWAGRAPGVGDVESFHPTECSFCELPRDLLVQALEEFKNWAHISDDIDEGTPLRLEMETWLALPDAEQRRQVERSAGRMELPPPPAQAKEREPYWTD